MRSFIIVLILFIVALQCSALGPGESRSSQPAAQPPAEQSADCHCRVVRERYRTFPRYCLQQLWMDYPGPNDLYVCIAEQGPACGDEADVELWYGEPSNSYRPQDCSASPNQCEAESWGEGKDGIPHHGMVLTSRTAWNLTRTALESAKMKTPTLEWDNPQFHKIKRSDIPEGVSVSGDVLVMAVRITGKYPGEACYFCLQIDTLDTLAGDALTEIVVIDAKPGAGAQFSIVYHVGENERHGLVWLR